MDEHDQYYHDNFNTQLSPEEENMFNQWLQQEGTLRGRDMSNDIIDYDMRGFYKGLSDQQRQNREMTPHFPDTYKKPNHPTFSNESIYNNTDNGDGGVFLGGSWSKKGDTFTPSQNMLEERGPDYFKYYFNQVEPNVKLIIPKRKK